MADDRIYDAINIFKYSSTGQGTRPAGGDSAYQITLANLARKATDVLWNLHSRGQISFSELQWDSTQKMLGGSMGRWYQPTFIKINTKLEPDSDPVKFCSLNSQAKLSAASLTMAHEAVHHARGFSRDLTEEVVCRTIEMLYYQDLLAGVFYTSRFAKAPCTAKLQALDSETTYIVTAHNDQLAWFQTNQLVDFVLLNSDEYKILLTTDWIVKSMSWWGGPRNRLPETKEIYLNKLAKRTPGTNPICNAVMELMESFPNNANWLLANVDPASLGGVLKFALYSNESTKRLRNIETKLAISFKMGL